VRSSHAAVHLQVLLISEVNAQDLAASANHSGVDCAHYERSHPGLCVLVECASSWIALQILERALNQRTEEKGIAHQLVRASFGHVQGRRQSASIQAAGYLKKGLHGRCLRTEGAGNEHCAEVGWDRVEPAERNQPRTLGGGLVLISVDQAADPWRFTGDITIVSAEPDAGIDDASAIKSEGSGGA